MLKSKPAVENKHAQVVPDCKMQPAKRLAWAAHRHSLQLPVKLLTLQETICGPALMIWGAREITITTTARRMQIIISKVHRRTCRAPIVEQPRQRSGVVIYVEKWFVMHADYTSNYTVSIDLTRCVAIQFTLADVVQKVTSQTEEVRSLIVLLSVQILIVLINCRVKEPRKSRTRRKRWC